MAWLVARGDSPVSYRGVFPPNGNATVPQGSISHHSPIWVCNATVVSGVLPRQIWGALMSP